MTVGWGTKACKEMILQPPISTDSHPTENKGQSTLSVRCLAAEVSRGLGLGVGSPRKEHTCPNALGPFAWQCFLALQHITERSILMKVGCVAKALSKIILQTSVGVGLRHVYHWSLWVSGDWARSWKYCLAMTDCVPVCPLLLGVRDSLQLRVCMFAAHVCNILFMPCTPWIWHGCTLLSSRRAQLWVPRALTMQVQVSFESSLGHHPATAPTAAHWIVSP